MIIFSHDPQVALPNHTDKATTLMKSIKCAYCWFGFFLFTWIKSMLQRESSADSALAATAEDALPDSHVDLDKTRSTSVLVKPAGVFKLH